MIRKLLISVGLVIMTGMSGASGQAPVLERKGLEEATDWLVRPIRTEAHYAYVMTGRVRLLFLWASKDDVGGGFIRMGAPAGLGMSEAIDLGFGSDPEKAPRQVNRWGAAREIHGIHRTGNDSVEAAAFLGFMSGARDDREEIELPVSGREVPDDGGPQRFEASLNWILPDLSVAGILKVASRTRLTFEDLNQVWASVLEHYQRPETGVEIRQATVPTSEDCSRIQGFLFAVRALIERSLAESEPAGLAVCYLHNARPYTLTLDETEAIPEETIDYTLTDGTRRETTYEDLRRLRFETLNRETGSTTEFELLVGSRDALRAVPVRITYRPNWWFEIVLHLRQDGPADPGEGDPDGRVRTRVN